MKVGDNGKQEKYKDNNDGDEGKIKIIRNSQEIEKENWSVNDFWQKARMALNVKSGRAKEIKIVKEYTPNLVQFAAD